MTIRVSRISNIDELIKLIRRWKRKHDVLWFRGQAKSSWKLLPRLARNPSDLIKEHDLITRFKQNASMWLDSRPETDWEWLSIMQHYGVPTRLLDWSENPLYALWFAVESTNTNGVLWALNPIELNKHSKIYMDNELEIPGFNDTDIKNYSVETFQQDTKSEHFPVAAAAPRTSKRMLSQLGVFAVFHRKPHSIERLKHGVITEKCLIEKGSKQKIREELGLIGVNKLQLFPELHVLGETLGSNTR